MLLVVTALLWSLGGAFLKSLPEVNWLMIAGVRSLAAALLFLPGLRMARPPARKLVPVVLLYAAVVTTLMGSMQFGTAAQGIWLQYTAPAVVALWAWRVRRQKPTRTEGAALALTGIALVLIVTGGSGVDHRYSLLLGLVSGIVYGGLIIGLKDLSDVPAPAIHVWTNLGAAALVLPIALCFGVPFPAAPRDLGLVVVMGLVQLAVPYHLFQWALKRTRALEASLILLLEPILNPTWAYLVTGEVPSPRVIAGCVLIACGLFAFTVGAAGRR